jgi:DUF4097 and DUF4098 domain-containing protein YvlB
MIRNQYLQSIMAITAAIWLVGCAHASDPVFQDGRYIQEFRYSFPAAGITSLDIENQKGHVSVLGIEGANEIVVAGRKVSRSRNEGRAMEEMNDIEIDAGIRRTAVRVRTHYPIQAIRRNHSYVEYVVTTPPDIATRISCASANVDAQALHEADIQCASGDVVVKHVGYAEIVVASGSIHLEHFKRAEVTQASGDLIASNGDNAHVTGASGDAALRDIQSVIVSVASGSVLAEQCDSASISTASGDVSAIVTESAEIRTASGDIRAEFQSEPTLLDMKSQSGDITVTLPASSSIAVDARTTSGRIRVVGIDLENIESGRRVLRGSHAGGEVPAKLKTVSGDVRIEAR